MDDVFVQHSVKVLSALNKQREEGRYCDATLVVGNVLFKAHWSILACSSPFFQSLYGDGTSANIILHESFAEVIGLVLDFLYTGELALTEENVQKVLLASKDLEVLEAIEVCERFQPKNLQSSDENEVNCQEITVTVEAVEDLTQTSEADVDILVLTNTLSQEGLTGQSHEQNSSVSMHQVPGEDTFVFSEAFKRTDEMEEHREFQRQKKSQRTDKSINSDGECMTWDLEVGSIHEDLTEDDMSMHEEVEEDDISEPKTPDSDHKDCVVKKITTENPLDLANRGKANKPVQCSTCHKTFLSKYYLKIHNRKHTGEKPFQCLKCGKSYFRKENLLKHEAQNCMTKNEQVLTCTECKEVFKRRMDLQVHMVSHTGEMPYKCLSCPQQFMQKKKLQNHNIKFHGAPKPHACPTCGKWFSTLTETRLHETFKHRGVKLFACEECGHRASSRSGLQTHIKAKHRNERPYVCEFCNHAFTQKTNLTVHLKTHSGEKPFQCHLCDKTFRTQASLYKHNRIHTGERPFSCPFCDHKFTDKTPLQRHMSSLHQEGRPHYCQICSKTFKTIEQLRVHIARHKGVRKFECKECGYKFTRQAHLRRHMEIHNRTENYNPRQRKLRNLIIKDEKMLKLSQASHPELEVGSAEVIIESISDSTLPELVTEEGICTEGFSPIMMEPTIIITATGIPQNCEP